MKKQVTLDLKIQFYDVREGGEKFYTRLASFFFFQISRTKKKIKYAAHSILVRF